MKIGCHISIAGGIEKAPRRAMETGCECFQIFTRSPRGGKAGEIEPSASERFLSDCRKFKISNCHVHTPYIINLASRETATREKSVKMIVDDLKRSDSIGAKCAVTHIGTSAGMRRGEAVAQAVRSIKKILDKTRGSRTKLLIENSAGQGSTLGDTFEEMAEILDGTRPDLGVCLDTAHLFAAGYEIRSPESFEKMLKNINTTFSAERIGLIHCNDSKTGLGSRKDRHEHIGKGEIGKRGFELLISCGQLKHIDIVAETPPAGSAEDVKFLKRIRRSVANRSGSCC